MHDIKWSNTEKKVARELFEAALSRELSETLHYFKERAANLSEIDDLWSLANAINKKRREIDEKYDFRYSQILRVFGQLLREERIDEEELQAFSDEKISYIHAFAGL